MTHSKLLDANWTFNTSCVKLIGLCDMYRNVPIRSALPNRSTPQMSLHIVAE